MSRKSKAAPPRPFRYFNSSPEVIRLVVMMYVKYPMSLRNVEDLLAERGINLCHETVRFWWNRFGTMIAAEIRRKRVDHMRACNPQSICDSCCTPITCGRNGPGLALDAGPHV